VGGCSIRQSDSAEVATAPGKRGSEALPEYQQAVLLRREEVVSRKRFHFTSANSRLTKKSFHRKLQTSSGRTEMASQEAYRGGVIALNRSSRLGSLMLTAQGH